MEGRCCDNVNWKCCPPVPEEGYVALISPNACCEFTEQECGGVCILSSEKCCPGGYAADEDDTCEPAAYCSECNGCGGCANQIYTNNADLLQGAWFLDETLSVCMQTEDKCSDGSCANHFDDGCCPQNGQPGGCGSTCLQSFEFCCNGTPFPREAELSCSTTADCCFPESELCCNNECVPATEDGCCLQDDGTSGRCPDSTTCIEDTIEGVCPTLCDDAALDCEDDCDDKCGESCLGDGEFCCGGLTPVPIGAAIQCDDNSDCCAETDICCGGECFSDSVDGCCPQSDGAPGRCDDSSCASDNNGGVCPPACDETEKCSDGVTCRPEGSCCSDELICSDGCTPSTNGCCFSDQCYDGTCRSEHTGGFCPSPPPPFPPPCDGSCNCIAADECFCGGIRFDPASQSCCPDKRLYNPNALSCRVATDCCLYDEDPQLIGVQPVVRTCYFGQCVSNEVCSQYNALFGNKNAFLKASRCPSDFTVQPFCVHGKFILQDGAQYDICFKSGGRLSPNEWCGLNTPECNCAVGAVCRA